MDKVVVLAAGLGKRMRAADSSSQLDGEQSRLADTGVKALIPIGRPFLDYVLSRVADAGYRRVCLVIGPDHHELRRYYEGLPMRRIRVEFAVQAKPLGTADAVAAAGDFVANDHFLMINSDNCYPSSVMSAMREADGCAVAGFEREALLAGGNIPAERVTRFAVLEADKNGYLRRVWEKPDPALLARLPEPVLISMNCWRFSPAIFTACGRIEKSTRGELEVPDAVMYSLERLGERYRVFPSRETVLDLSSRQDVASVGRHLASVEVEL